jgi:hypothetical protein
MDLRLFLIIITSLILYCRISKIPCSKKKIDSKLAFTSPEIMFLNYTIKRNKKEISINLINYKIVEGQLKKSNQYKTELVEGLKCTQLDENYFKLDSVLIPN